MPSRDLPATPRELWGRLTRIFPAFAETLSDPDLEEDSASTYHSVMQPFTVYFGAHHSGCSQSQLAQLASLINAAVERADDLENAVATCFLEHLRQLRAEKAMARLLSSAAKKRLHA